MKCASKVVQSSLVILHFFTWVPEGGGGALQHRVKYCQTWIGYYWKAADLLDLLPALGPLLQAHLYFLQQCPEMERTTVVFMCIWIKNWQRLFVSILERDRLEIQIRKLNKISRYLIDHTVSQIRYKIYYFIYGHKQNLKQWNLLRVRFYCFRI